MRLQIERVLSTAPPQQKPSYTVYEWVVSGWIDGNYAAEIKVQTLSGKEADFVQAGWDGQVDLDAKYGQHYKIPTPQKGANSQGMNQGLPKVASAAPPPPPQGAPPPPNQLPPPPSSPRPAPQGQAPAMKFMDVVEAYSKCFAAAEYIAREHGWTDQECAESVPELLSIAATLFIECNKKGIKIPTKKKEEDPHQAKIRAINAAIAEAQLDVTDIDPNVLEAWWDEANGVAAAFVERINQEMTPPEAAAEEEDDGNQLPF